LFFFNHNFSTVNSVSDDDHRDADHDHIDHPGGYRDECQNEESHDERLGDVDRSEWERDGEGQDCGLQCVHGEHQYEVAHDDEYPDDDGNRDDATFFKPRQLLNNYSKIPHKNLHQTTQQPFSKQTY